jgi:hypothetical protein
MTLEHSHVAKSVIRVLYLAGILSGDQFTRSLECLDAAIKFNDMGGPPQVNKLTLSALEIERLIESSRVGLKVMPRTLVDLTIAALNAKGSV